MEISFQSKPVKNILWPWLVASFLGLAFMLVIHLGVYVLFYCNKITLSQHFSGFWLSLYLYALVWPSVIIHNYKSRILKVKHNGELNIQRLKDYFIDNSYKLIDEQPGLCRFEALKWFDRLFKGSRNVRIVYSEYETTIEMPANKIYDVHHGFKFSGIFLNRESQL